jgi:hypothetical protein
LDRIDPFISFQGFSCFTERVGTNVHEVLERGILVDIVPSSSTSAGPLVDGFSDIPHFAKEMFEEIPLVHGRRVGQWLIASTLTGIRAGPHLH